MNQIVHQVRYRWSPSSLVGTRGMGPVESTLPEQLLAIWDQHLRDHVWAADAKPAFTFVVRGGTGALLRKFATTVDGRPGSVAHALLSPAITAVEALGLTHWDGWEASIEDGLSWSDLQPVAAAGLTEVRRQARTLPGDQLASLFAQLLTAPSSDYTVVGELDPLAVTCALGDLIGRTPEFASDEADDLGGHLPTAVFLRAAPYSSTAVTRRRLNPTVAQADPAFALFARAAVDAYRADGPEGIAVIRRSRPPADAHEVHEWMMAAQFAPGVLADLARLPRLNRAELEELLNLPALQRVQGAATAAPSSVLIRALDRRLPDEISAILVREAVHRVLRGPTDQPLLERLAQFAPLPPELLVATDEPIGFGRLAYVTRALLTADDRLPLLRASARHVALVELIRWLRGQAPADHVGALAAYSAVCDRVRRASPEEVETLIAEGALIDAVRQFSTSMQQSSRYLVTLLASLPRRVLRSEIVARLAARGDPALLHALDAVVTDRRRRAIVHNWIRLAFYRAYQLGEPPEASNGPVLDDSTRRRRRSRSTSRRVSPEHWESM